MLACDFYCFSQFLDWKRNQPNQDDERAKGGNLSGKNLLLNYDCKDNTSVSRSLPENWIIMKDKSYGLPLLWYHGPTQKN